MVTKMATTGGRRDFRRLEFLSKAHHSSGAVMSAVLRAIAASLLVSVIVFLETIGQRDKVGLDIWFQHGAVIWHFFTMDQQPMVRTAIKLTVKPPLHKWVKDPGAKNGSGILACCWNRS